MLLFFFFTKQSIYQHRVNFSYLDFIGIFHFESTLEQKHQPYSTVSFKNVNSITGVEKKTASTHMHQNLSFRVFQQSHRNVLTQKL